MQSDIRIWRLFGLLCVCLLGLTPASVHGQPTQSPLPDNARWNVQADRLQYSQSESRYTAEGNVEIIQGEKQLSADHVVLNRQTMWATATGHVHFKVGRDQLVGDRLKINLDSGIGTLYHGIVFIEKNHFFIKGNEIKKTGTDTYAIRQGGLTTCEQKNPDWRITGKAVDVTLEGYGTIRGAGFWIKNVPVFYAPFFWFPAKTERQSGLLPPQMAYSDRKGFEYIQPYFWAISDHTDATFYYHHLRKRGEKAGLEYRYAASRKSRGTFMFDGFEDRKIDDGTENAGRKWGYTDDNEIRPNSDRYWFRMKADQAMPYGMTAQLDLDVVSDQDYLREFSDGYTGYDDNLDYFDDTFGRDLDDEDDPVRQNRLNFNRLWTYASFNTDFVWYDNVINRRLKDTDSTLQRLPMITFNALKQPLYGDLLYADLDTEYDFFYRQDASDSLRGQTGHRIDIHPRLYMPLRFQNYFTLEPSVGFRQTAYYIDTESEALATDNRDDHRELYDLGAELTTDIERIFSVPGEKVEKIKHTVVPKLEYNYIPETDQSEYADFDELDRIDGQNRLTFSLTQFFTSRRTRTRTDKKPEPSYNMFARFMIEQPYDFKRRSNPDEAFLPLFAELDFTPLNLLTLHADAEWSHEIDTILSSSASCRVTDSRGDRFRVDYRYNRDINQSIYFEIEAPVTRWLTVYGGYERSLIDDIDIEQKYGALVKSGCWSVDFGYKNTQDLDRNRNESYAVLVNLYGLGEIGNRL
ncbi:MAG: LPS-assembly protein LptD [Thermodesulfobacteriota bacterium]